MADNEPSQNPYAPPSISAAQSGEKPALPKPTFYDQAAKFSLYAPFVMLAIRLLNLSQNSAADAQVLYVLMWIAILTTIAAFVLGIVGFVGGISRRAVGTIVRAVGGILLNGGILALVGWTIYQLWTAKWHS